MTPSSEAVERTLFIVTIASTRTSTIEGISIAGPTAEATLLTPGLDVEYLLLGKPRSLNVVPVSPQGVPTPALITRAALSLAQVTPMVLDAGSHLEPQVPHARLPSRRVGGRIDQSPALPPGTSRALYEEARLLAKTLAPGGAHAYLGESMPGGTTTALALLQALGVDAWERVSSASPQNPRGLKRGVVERALERLGGGSCGDDVFCVNDQVGDPLHITIAGLARGLLEEGAHVTLAGGTQMAAVLALLKASLGGEWPHHAPRVEVATTRWVAEEPSSDWRGLVEDIDPTVKRVVASVTLPPDAPGGLRLYEEGYGKEGVGAGGALVLALRRGFTAEELAGAILGEYRRLLSLQEAKQPGGAGAPGG